MTGNAFTLPHVLYTRQDDVGHHHFFFNGPDKAYAWLQQIPQELLLRASTTVWFLLGAPLCFGLLIALLVPRLKRANSAAPITILRLPSAVLWAVLAVLVAQALVVPWWPHYPSPAYPALLLLALIGLHNASAVTFLDRDWRPALVGATLICAVFGALARLPAHRHDPGSEQDVRTAIIERLEAAGGRHLIFVDPGMRTSSFWTRHPSKPLEQNVLWAWSLAPASDRDLVNHLQRTPWRLNFDPTSSDRLLPYSVSSE